ncbi:MAG: hydroxyethylthiazole kinase [Xanthobacteraceae bacterium]|jgi:hydroxyethylthiazole kinase
MHAPVELADIAADILARVRDRAPRVHCITNTVAQNYTANMLLAAGAVPSMTISPEEIVSFVASADALLVNLGTLDTERRGAIDAALGAVDAARMPWALDPVFIESSPGRAQFARELLRRGPSAVRLNPAEFAPLFGGDPAAPAAEAAARAAEACATVVALTGGIDIVTDGARRVASANGHPLMGLVTAMGCASSALVCAALAVETDAWLATLAALAALGVAGEVAGASARGPGSFASAIIDALHGLDRATLRARIKVS